MKVNKNRQSEICLAYAQLAKKLDKYPNRVDLRDKNISRETVRHHFGNMEALKEAALALYPDCFSNIITLEHFSNDLYKKQVEVTKKFKTHVITTAVSGAPVHEEFLGSLLNYCRAKNAALWIIPADYALQDIDKNLVENPNVNIVFRQIRLNQRASINPIKIDPKQVDPAVGLDAFAHDEGTVVIGSPKQRRVGLPNAQSKIAPIIQATGALTRPNYTKNHGSRRRDALATKHHVMGAVVIEIKDEKIHFPRNVMMCKDGSFNDLGINYASDEIKPTATAAIIPGDWHVGVTDPVVRQVIFDVCKKAAPEYLVLHDFTDFISINPHEEENELLRAFRASEGLTLESEFRMNADEIQKIRAKKPASKAILFVYSNHPDFLPRYLSKGRFNDHDRIIATKLRLLAWDKKDPYEEGLYTYFGVPRGKDIKFLSINDEFRVAGVELAAHGHLGANGKRNPGAKGMFKSYGNVAFAHIHHGEIFHGAMSSGTSTYKNLGYNPGASSWDNAFQWLYPDGTRQLIGIIKGEYTR